MRSRRLRPRSGVVAIVLTALALVVTSAQADARPLVGFQGVEATNAATLSRDLAAVGRMHGNTIRVQAYWSVLQPEGPGRYDETALAEAQISREDRGHLQSHGLTGVQAKHYDDYNYIKNKRKALDALFILLTAAKQK